VVLLCDMGQVEALSIHLEKILILTQDRFYAERAIGLESIWVHLMELLGNMGQVEAHFDLFEDCVNLGARYVYGLCRTYHRLGN
jgi:hypothetical protein